ncbi:putative ribonuclease H domain, reverse transcriptase zinc-binding domain-containing protein [Arabidopsis thaliana]
MALPTYTMSCFKIPKTICQQIESVMAEFWWKNKKEGRGLHWKAWCHLSRPKAVGGIGFKEIEAFNIALLGKQLWRMITVKDSLMAKIFKSRYFSKSDPLNAPLGSRPSFAWKSIYEAQVLIKQGIRAVIGNGETINVWTDPWIGAKPAKAAQAVKRSQLLSQYAANSIHLVKDLLLPDGRDWNWNLVSLLFPDNTQENILALRPGGKETRDRFTWEYSRTGHYSVKSGYWVMTEIINQRNNPQEVLQPSLDPIFQQIWKLDVPPKIHHFLWRCVNNCLSVASNLAYRHLAREKSCVRCPSHGETVNHLLFKCTFARLTWAISPLPAPPGGEWAESLFRNMHHALSAHKSQPQESDHHALIPWILWRLWKNRNDLVFKGREFTAPQVILKATEDMDAWNNHGAWSKDLGNCGVGWVLRNHTGRLLWLGLRALPRQQSALETEVEALRWAVLSLSRFNYRRVVFESDSQYLVSLIQNEMDIPSLAPKIQDIRNLLRHFEEVKFQFTRREGNNVADRTARESLSLMNYDPKLYSIMPDWIKNLVDLEAV